MYQDKNKSTLFLCQDKTRTLSVSQKHSLILVRQLELHSCPSPALPFSHHLTSSLPAPSQFHLWLWVFCLPVIRTPWLHWIYQHQFSSVSRSVVSVPLQPYEPQQASPPCPSPTPGAYPNPCPLSRWCDPTISSSVIPFSSCPQSSPTSGLFKWSALCIRWPKYWSYSFSISPSNEHPGLISFRMDWLDLLTVQGTLKSLLQHHSSKASILQHSAFLIV